MEIIVLIVSENIYLFFPLTGHAYVRLNVRDLQDIHVCSEYYSYFIQKYITL